MRRAYLILALILTTTSAAHAQAWLFIALPTMADVGPFASEGDCYHTLYQVEFNFGNGSAYPQFSSNCVQRPAAGEKGYRVLVFPTLETLGPFVSPTDCLRVQAAVEVWFGNLEPERAPRFTTACWHEG